jgi:hypothetical protein
LRKIIATKLNKIRKVSSNKIAAEVFSIKPISGESTYSTPQLSRPSQPKRVSFHSVCDVIFIPTREEFKVAGLSESIWWKADDYDTFKKEQYSI